MPNQPKINRTQESNSSVSDVLKQISENEEKRMASRRAAYAANGVLVDTDQRMADLAHVETQAAHERTPDWQQIEESPSSREREAALKRLGLAADPTIESAEQPVSPPAAKPRVCRRRFRRDRNLRFRNRDSAE